VEIVLVHPEIPHNSGCAARLAAATGLRLHLVEPLGFSLEDRYLKRAGLDYWPLVDLSVHASWEDALSAFAREGGRPVGERLRPFTARGGTSLFSAEFQPDDLLVFGCESRGLPASIRAAHAEATFGIPLASEHVRSLNLATAVAVVMYEALRQLGKV